MNLVLIENKHQQLGSKLFNIIKFSTWVFYMIAAKASLTTLESRKQEFVAMLL